MSNGKIVTRSQTRQNEQNDTENNIRVENSDQLAILQKAINVKGDGKWKNLCIKCGVDIGDMNCRQLCGKTYCLIYSSADENTSETSLENTSQDVKRLTKSKRVRSSKTYRRVNKKRRSGDNLPLSITPEGRKIAEDAAKSFVTKIFNGSSRSDRKKVPTTKDLLNDSFSSTEADDTTTSDDEHFADTILKNLTLKYKTTVNDNDDNSDIGNIGGSNRSDDSSETSRDKELQFIEMQYNPRTHGIRNSKHKSLLKQLKKMRDDKTPSIKEVVSLNCDKETMADIIDHIIVMKNLPMLTFEYLEARSRVNDLIDEVRDIPTDRQAELDKLTSSIKRQNPSIRRILCSSLPTPQKIELIRKIKTARALQFNHYAKEKTDIECEINDTLVSYNKATSSQIQLREDIGKCFSDDLYERKLSEIRDRFPEAIFRDIMMEYKEMKSQSCGDEEAIKIKRWLKYIINFPWEVKPYPISSDDPPEKFVEFERVCRDKLNKHIFGMDEIKEEILRFVFAKIRNCSAKRNVIGLESSPGMGKSTIAKAIADCLEIPCVTINMGGQNDISNIRGHSKTYISAVPGKIIEELCRQKYINCMFFLDEIDKASSRHGEMEGALCNLLDPDHNNAWEDFYMGFPVDISTCLFTVAMNDRNLCGGIVNSRVQIHKLKKYSHSERTEMAISHLIPKLMDNLLISSDTLVFTKKAVRLINNLSNIKEDGVRQFMRNLDTILKKINMMYLKKDGYFANNAPLPLVVTTEIAKDLFSEPESTISESVRQMHM